MSKKVHKGTKVFIITFAVSFVLLMCIFLIFFLFGSFNIAEPTVRPQEDIQYIPKPQENFNLLIIGCERIELEPSFLMLVKYDAEAASMSLIPLDPNTDVNIGFNKTTLLEQYNFSGIRGCVTAVKNLLLCDVDRYIRIDATGITNLTDYKGGIPYEFSEGLISNGITFSKGRQLLDGRRTAALLFGDADLTLKGDIAKTYLKEHFNADLEYDKYISALFYNIETNINQYDMAIRQKGFLSILSRTLNVESIPLNITDGVPESHTLDKLIGMLQGGG